MGDVEVHTEGGDEGDTAAVYQRAEAAQEREGRVRKREHITLKRMLEDEVAANYPTLVRQAPHRRHRWLRMQLS